MLPHGRPQIAAQWEFKQLTPDRSRLVRSRVDGEIVIGRLINDVQDFPAWDMDAARSAVALSIEMPVVKEIDPMGTVVSTRGGVEMEGGHSTVKAIPSEGITSRLF